jgi:ribonuclease HI
MSEKIYVYCDGAVKNNQSRTNIGACGAILFYGKHKKEFSNVVHDTTNQKMELSSAILALNSIKDKSLPVSVIMDSQYVVSGVNEWSKNWIKNGWKNAKKKPVWNQDLWRWLLDLISKFDNVEFVKCEAHKDNDGNNQVDDLCNKVIENEISWSQTQVDN